MIPGFPHSIRIRLAGLKTFFVASWTANRAETEQRQEATKKIFGSILFLYYEENLAHIIKFELKTI